MTAATSKCRLTVIIGPIMAFRKYIFTDVIPAFGNLDRRADKVADEFIRDRLPTGLERC